MSPRFYLFLGGWGIALWLGSSCREPLPTGRTENADGWGTDLATRTASAAAPAAAVPAEIHTFNWPVEDDLVMAVAEAVMVTAELEFGPNIPSIAEALRAVDREYQPDAGGGRTFAILDAYGEPTVDGKLHISMHVSSEKPGRGALVHRRTGQVLWCARIRPAAPPAPAAFTGKKLDIMITDEQGHEHLLDGSGGGPSILDAAVQDQGVRLREFWPDGAERQLIFFYSACGCPVKIMCRRQGERTVRTKDLPVIFPDDPDALGTIRRLLGWGEF